MCEFPLQLAADVHILRERRNKGHAKNGRESIFQTTTSGESMLRPWYLQSLTWDPQKTWAKHWMESKQSGRQSRKSWRVHRKLPMTFEYSAQEGRETVDRVSHPRHKLDTQEQASAKDQEILFQIIHAPSCMSTSHHGWTLR